VRSIFYLLDSAPYGSEKAYGVLNAAAVSIKMDATLGLYADGVYLALAGQNSSLLDVPNLSDILYAYPELRVLAHEPSLVERVELLDEEDFVKLALAADDLIAL
jgi:tRNA 2-thiouridine synthesizing protein C